MQDWIWYRTLLMRISLLFVLAGFTAIAAPPEPEPTANRLLRDYFAREVSTLESQPLPSPQTTEDWERRARQCVGSSRKCSALIQCPSGLR
jgi:hypothetical protein